MNPKVSFWEKMKYRYRKRWYFALGYAILALYFLGFGLYFKVWTTHPILSPLASELQFYGLIVLIALSLVSLFLGDPWNKRKDLRT